jgi:hypothetical protein
VFFWLQNLLVSNSTCTATPRDERGGDAQRGLEAVRELPRGARVAAAAGYSVAGVGGGDPAGRQVGVGTFHVIDDSQVWSMYHSDTPRE